MDILSEKEKERIEQVREMEFIWNKSDEMTRMFLKGCIVTASALAGKKEIYTG